MPDHYLFKCKTCMSAEIVGPEVEPTRKLTLNAPFDAVPGVQCKTNMWHKGVVYVGTRFFPPKAPPLGPKAAPSGPPLPTVWVMGDAGRYVSQKKYASIPDVAQQALINELEPLLSKPDDRVMLLGASVDRFSDYDDVEDVPIEYDDKAEQWLTVPLVLDRLNRVAASLGNIGLWKPAQIDRNLGDKSAFLTLPAGVDGYKFHLELLNDLVNPRGGHAVAADTFAAAVKKGVALGKANEAADDTRDNSRAYYFYSTRSKRGVTVVLRGTMVLSVYYSNAATQMFAHGVPKPKREARTVA